MSTKPEDKDLKYKTIEEVFQTQYYIDFYQREYTWEWNNVSTLIDDIYYRFDLRYSSESETSVQYIRKNYKWYYLNTYIVNKQGNRTCIVDGQQRFSTLTLILIKLYHLARLKELSDTRIDNLKDLICKTTASGNIFWMGGDDRHETLEDIFKRQGKGSSMRKLNMSEENLFDRYQKISKELDTKFNENHKHFLDCFIIYFVTMVKLVEIELKESDDVAMVFEVINAKGQKLKSHEILKAQLLSQIAKDELDEYLKLWGIAMALIRQADLTYPNIDDPVDAFFTYFFRGRYTETQNELTTFKDYHKTIFSRDWHARLPLKDESFVKGFIKIDLMYYAKVVFLLSQCSPDNFKYVYYNDLNSLMNQYVLLFSSLKPDDINEKTKIDLVSKLVDRHYSLLRLQGCYESTTFSKQLMSLVFKLRNNDDLNDIQAQFDQHLLKDINEEKNSTVAELMTYNFFKNTKVGGNNKQFLRYFFARIEDFLCTKIKGQNFLGYDALVNGRKYHIEHILGQNDENKSIFKNEDFFIEQRDRIGGLLLLVKGDNEMSLNETYINKLKTYENDTFYAKTLTPNHYHNNSGMKNFSIKYPNIRFRHIPPPFNLEALDERQTLAFELAKTIWC